MTMEPIVRALNLTKVHQVGEDQVYGVNEISLEVYPGEMLGIRGRNGEGKSTLMHILGCLQRPDTGKLSIEGQEVTQLDDDDLARLRFGKLGFVFEAFNLVPNETSLRNVEIPMRHQGMDPSESREKAVDALTAVGLGTRLDHTPGQLSQRQRQCVAIARAIANGPIVIFLDEPTRGLDSSSREEIIGLLQKLNGEGTTIVMSTAESGVASHCRRVVRLTEGKAVEDRLVRNRRMIPAFRVPGPPPPTEEREEETCQRCKFPLNLSPEEANSIEVRLSGSSGRFQGVEDALDEGDVAGGQLIEGLREVPCFSGLGPKSLVKIVPALEQQQYPRGSRIIKQGEPGDSFYILTSGNAQVVLERPGRPDTPIAPLGPSDGFGEMALLTDQPRSANVVAMTDVEVWRLPKEAFDGLLEENLSLAIYFNRILAQRLRALQERIAH